MTEEVTPKLGTLSKHAYAKQVLEEHQRGCHALGLDPDEGLEALLTWCIQKMQSQRGGNFARDYVQYELSALGSGSLYDVQKR